MKTVLHIEGMSCDHCVHHVKEALEGIKGVTAALVSLADKTAVVEHTEAVGRDTLVKAVEEADYTVV
jgi:copper chaperone CopZ